MWHIALGLAVYLSFHMSMMPTLRELVALLSLSSWCLVMVQVVWLFLAVPWVSMRFVIMVFPDDTHLLFLHLKRGLFN